MLEFVERCVDAAPWAYEEKHEQVFVIVTRGEDGEWDTLKNISGTSLCPAKRLFAHTNAHLITSAILFVRHMDAHHGVDLNETMVHVSRGCDTPRWHTDGDHPLLRTIVSPLAAGHVRHTEFEAIACPYANEGSGTYFSGDVTHRSPPETAEYYQRWFLRIRFSWKTQPDAQTERDALGSWRPPTILETSIAEQFKM